MLFIEFSLILSMFLTHNQGLAFIVLAFGLLSVLFSAIGVTRPDSYNKFDRLTNIPIVFCYCYYIYTLTMSFI